MKEEGRTGSDISDLLGDETARDSHNITQMCTSSSGDAFPASCDTLCLIAHGGLA